MGEHGEVRARIQASLNRYISSSGYTQKEIAEKLGVSKSSVTNWLKGKNSPDANLVMPICNLLNITVGQFYGEEEKSPSTDESAPGEEQAEVDPLRSTLLHNFDLLNQEGRERLVETSDDMVSSRKYIKSDSDKLGNEKLA